MELRILLVSDNPDRRELLQQSLQDAGHSVVDRVTTDVDLISVVDRSTADVLVVDSDAPDQKLLTNLRELSRQLPRPVVLFTEEDNRTVIQKAVQSGVSAYIVDGLDQNRIGSILAVAVARFGETERLRRELQSTRNNLLERKAVERAKGILMKQRGCDEPEAYHALRKMAMDKNLRIGQVAENVIAVAELLN